MAGTYKRPLCVAQVEFAEKKSRFIGHLAPASSEEEALAFLRRTREKHREANHNVYAYRIMDSGICRHSDAGEPSGTAGMPLLDVFMKQNIYDFCCVATRYFGGILLGAGGLIRAYARCGVLALESSGIGFMRECTLCAVTLPYALYAAVKRLLDICGAEIGSEDFGVEIVLRFTLVTEKLAQLQQSLVELTSGAVTADILGTRMAVSSPKC